MRKVVIIEGVKHMSPSKTRSWLAVKLVCRSPELRNLKQRLSEEGREAFSAIFMTGKKFVLCEP